MRRAKGDNLLQAVWNAHLKKYVRSFGLSVFVMIQYKADMVSWFVFGLLNISVFIFAWLGVLNGRASIGGFTKSDFIVYYLFFAVGWYIVAGFFAGQLAEDIKNGIITPSLLKPYNKVMERVIKEQAWKVVSITVITPIVLFGLYLLRNLISVELTPMIVSYFIISLVLATINFALFQVILGCLAFWIDEVWPLLEIYWIASTVFGGSLAPLQFMPPIIQLIASFLPFKYVFSTPVIILLNKSPNATLELFIQFLYAVIMYLIMRIMWKAGVRRYEAYGG